MDARRPLSDVPKSIKSRTRSYMDTQEPALHEALADCSLEQKQVMLKRPDEFREDFVRRGMAGAAVDRLCLLSRTVGYYVLIDHPENFSQPDLERLLDSAFKDSGLQKAVILGLVSDLTATLNAACRIDRSNAPEVLEKEVEREALQPYGDAPAFTVPFSFYAEELDSIHEYFKRWRTHGTDIPPKALKRLQALCALGIPEAQYYLGYYRMKKPDEITREEEYALQWLERAARAGNADASAALGDYYYNRGRNLGKADYWGRALAYYTGYGAPALDKPQRKAVRDILSQREKKERILRGSKIWTVVTGLWALLGLLIMPTLPEKILGIVYAVCNGWLCFRFKDSLRKHPYDSATNLVIPLLVALVSYMILLFLLVLILNYMGGG